MKKLSVFIFLFTIASFAVSAQKKLNQVPKFIEWAENPTVHPLAPEYKNEAAYFILNDVSMDYRFEGRHTSDYVTIHWIVKVLNDKGIQAFNQISFPVNSHTRVPEIKARTITTDGKVRDIAKEMIKVTKDEYGRNKIVFAMEGVEKNAEIEFLIRLIKPFSAFGEYDFQYNIPTVHSRFEMSYPKDLVFETKGYNGFPTGKDTLQHNRRHILITENNIPALRPEPHSFYNQNRMRVEYKLVSFIDGNLNDSRRLNSWDDFGRVVFNDDCKFTDKEKGAVNKFLSDLGVPGHGNEAENIRKIENGIKNNIVLYRNVDFDDQYEVYAYNQIRSVSKNAAEYDDTKSPLDSIISNRAATHEGYLRLFAACFAQAGVKYQVGMAGNRHDYRFDSKFENWSRLEYYMIYFPNLHQFISPTNMYCRFPIIPAEVLNNKGVFCAIPPNNVVSGRLMELIPITPLPAAASQKNLNATVSFNPEMDAHIDATYSFSGYPATDLREAIAHQPKSKITELVENMMPLAEKPEHLLSYEIKNDKFEAFNTNRPLKIIASINAPQLTEQAGEQYLFRLGDVIGTQAELYTEETRVMPVDFDYPYELNRTITINIPKGYQVLNTGDIKLHSDFVDPKLKPVLSFNSDYNLIKDKENGDKLVVTINEFYKLMHFSADDYEIYRKVFNTAADFNKVSLVFQKIKGYDKKMKKHTAAKSKAGDTRAVATDKKAKPEAPKAKQADNKTKPEVKKAKPEEKKAKPEVKKAKPEEKKAKPEDPKSKTIQKWRV